MSAARSRAGIRHDDGPVPADYAARVRREREAVSRWLAWAAIAAVALAFGQHATGIVELFR